jgi:hypothetical protein
MRPSITSPLNGLKTTRRNSTSSHQHTPAVQHTAAKKGTCPPFTLTTPVPWPMSPSLAHRISHKQTHRPIFWITCTILSSCKCNKILIIQNHLIGIFSVDVVLYGSKTGLGEICGFDLDQIRDFCLVSLVRPHLSAGQPLRLTRMNMLGRSWSHLVMQIRSLKPCVHSFRPDAASLQVLVKGSFLRLQPPRYDSATVHRSSVDAADTSAVLRCAKVAVKHFCSRMAIP